MLINEVKKWYLMIILSIINGLWSNIGIFLIGSIVKLNPYIIKDISIINDRSENKLISIKSNNLFST